jgi:hypothetical protein
MRKTGGRSGLSKRYRQKRRSKSIRMDFVFTFLLPHSASTKLRAPTRIFKGGKRSYVVDYFPQSSSASRFTAGAFGFLTFTQCGGASNDAQTRRAAPALLRASGGPLFQLRFDAGLAADEPERTKMRGRLAGEWQPIASLIFLILQ